MKRHPMGVRLLGGVMYSEAKVRELVDEIAMHYDPTSLVLPVRR